MLKLFNTLTRRKEVFKLQSKTVKMYNCGPTVYDYAHIGNLRSYIFADLLRRYLEYRGFKVKQVMNITDVDDKTIKGSQSEKISLKEFTKRYESAFFQDLSKLKIKKAVYPKATKHINEMLALIKILLNKKIAYKSEDGVYFDISKFKDYGKLSHFRLHELKPGARIRSDLYSKDEAQDFALWKFWQSDDGDVFWQADFGKGRPGWHIECSAMSMKYLGKTLDIHTGGVDLIFPHHENEIAQSEAATGKKFVRYWLHCEHLLVENQKMAKSLGNIITLRDVLAKKFSSNALRYLLISSHYRKQINFTYDSLKRSEETINKLNDFVSWLRFLMTKKLKPNKKILSLVKKAKTNFEKYMDDDLNTTEALAALHDMITEVNKEIDNRRAGSVKEVYNFILDINKILAVIETKEEKLTKEEKSLVEKREKLRKEKLFDESDKIRSVLKENGVALEDTPYGVRWKKIKSSIED